jgi:transcriptional regulator with XRE-family HTH domain
MAAPDETTVRIGKRLKEIRLSKGITQAEVAKRAKLHPNYYSRVERADISPSIETYKQIAKVLGVSAKDIFPF